jgi:succinate dehydrogenase/fumarate reductase flavoprotein subunit
MQFNTEVIETDVLIIGGGLAGCMAGIKASESDCRVTIAEKANTKRSGSTGSGIDHLWAYIPPIHEKMGWKLEDLMEDHAQAVAYGGFMRWDLLRLMAETSYERVLNLESFGLKFRFDDSPIPGKFRIVTQFHSVPSSFNFEGRDLKPKLTDEAQRRGVRIVNRVMVTDILTSHGEVCGAVGISTREPKVYLFRTKAVVLSSSGRLSRLNRSVMGGNFNRRLSPTGTTGDGKLMALNAGAELINVELYGAYTFQLGIKNYTCAGGAPRNTLQPACRIVDARGNVIIPRTSFYDWKTLGKIKIQAEETRKRFVEGQRLRAVPLKHYREGNRPLYYDFVEGTDEEIKYIEWSMSNEGKMWILLKYLKEQGVNLKRDKIEIGLRDREASANSASGVWCDKDCESGVPGLFAAGDEIGGVPWSSAPGAITTGWHAGRKAAEKAVQMRTAIELEISAIERVMERYRHLTERARGDKWLEVEYAIQDIMDTYLGDMTSEQMLSRGLDRIAELKSSCQLWADNPHDLMRCLEVENLAEIGELIMLAARERKESRAVLKRFDYPDPDDKNWFAFLGIRRKGDGKIIFSKKPIKKSGEA